MTVTLTGTPVIHTKRLILRAPEPWDAAPFCAFLASIFLLPEVCGHAGGDENDREHDASPAIALEGHESPASKH